jgi:cytochrome c-type biogenesis protein CcmH
MNALRALLVASALLALPPAALAGPSQAPPSDDVSSRPPAPGERTLLGRLIAPCCWQQTLDVHESPLTRDLRREIRGRLYAGETPAAIEESLVVRYGERIRAAPTRDPMKNVAGGLLVVALAVGGLVVVALRRLRARAPKLLPAAGAPLEHDDYDDRLDDELRRLDEG